MVLCWFVRSKTILMSRHNQRHSDIMTNFGGIALSQCTANRLQLHCRADGMPHEVSPGEALINKVADNYRSQHVLNFSDAC